MLCLKIIGRSWVVEIHIFHTGYVVTIGILSHDAEGISMGSRGVLWVHHGGSTLLL